MKQYKVTWCGVHSSLRRGPVGGKELNHAGQNPFYRFAQNLMQICCLNLTGTVCKFPQITWPRNPFHGIFGKRGVPGNPL